MAMDETCGTNSIETATLTRQLQTFRATHLRKRLVMADLACSYKRPRNAAWTRLACGSSGRIAWDYFASGTGPQTLLLLPGGPGLGEMAFQHIALFESTYRVIAPDYPAHAQTIQQLLAGVMAILEHENITRCAIIGGSYGGMLAQCLVRNYPERVQTLILDHTSPPTRARARTHKLYYHLFNLLPLSAIRKALWLGNHLPHATLNPGQTFWRDYFDQEVIGRLTKHDYMSRAAVCVDFYQNYTFTCNDLHSWDGSLLIIEAADDSYVSREDREILKALYPSALVHTFYTTGHTAWATQFATFHALMADFLEEHL